MRSQKEDAAKPHKVLGQLERSSDADDINIYPDINLLSQELFGVLNKVATTLLQRKKGNFEDAMSLSVNLISKLVDFDRMSVFKEYKKSDGTYLKQLYRWTKESKGASETIRAFEDSPYEKHVPRWARLLVGGECVNGPIEQMPEGEVVKPFGCKSVLVIPVFKSEALWGFALFENREKEIVFPDQEVDMMRSASFMLVNVIIQNEEEKASRATNERAQLMLDATPLACRLWDENLKLIECNEAAVKLYGAKNKQDYIKRFNESLPNKQPNGERTSDIVTHALKKTFADGYYRRELVYQTFEGVCVPTDNILVCVPHGDSQVVCVYSRDLREHKRMLAEIEHRDNLLQTVNSIADSLLRAEPTDFDSVLYQCMALLAQLIGADRMRITKTFSNQGVFYRTQTHSWCTRSCTTCNVADDKSTPFDKNTAYIREKMILGEGINARVSDLPSPDSEFFAAQGIKVLMLVPVVIQEELWGYIGFNKCLSDQPFSENEESIMHSGALIIVNILLRNEFMLNLQEASAQLEIALEDARQANNAKSNFLAQMSHEIRTPLNAVVGLSELALADTKLNEEEVDRLEKIHDSGRTILSIINDILDISKIESGRFELHLCKYDSPSLINDIVSLNTVRIGEKPITFELSVPDDLPGVLFGDDLRVKQIFNNVLSNAFKYTKAGKVEWNISFESDGESADSGASRNTGSNDSSRSSLAKDAIDDTALGSCGNRDNIWLVSQIKDTGIGIKPKDLIKLFSEYSQVATHANRNVEGTGLGLIITKRLVEMMGGTIKLTSEFGVGTTVTVRLRQGVAADTTIGSSVAQRLMNLKYSLSKHTDPDYQTRIDLSYASVLVVDDIATNLDVVKGMLKPYKVRVDCASSAKQAIEMIASEEPRYSAVFMDHMMPEMDGIEATYFIRNKIGTEYAKNIPIIALTANALVGNEEMFLSQGFQAFVPKPIDMKKLDTVLRQLVGNKQQEAPCLDLNKAQKRFGNDKSVLMDVLGAYTKSTPGLLVDLDKQLQEGRFKEYEITVHGIKSSSYSICADEVGKAAQVLETAAKLRDIDTIRVQHAVFVNSVYDLIKSIKTIVEKNNNFYLKPIKDFPDHQLLIGLKNACRAFDIGKVNATMAQLDAFNYKEGEELISWLKEHVGDMDFEEIADLDVSKADFYNKDR